LLTNYWGAVADQLLWEAEVRFASAILVCFMLIYSAGAAQAEKRVALVIGNGAYKNAPALMNPKNDAEDIGKSLRELGFFTIIATDLDRAGMNDVLDRFSRAVGGAEIALVYYSGHGMQFAGKNYLLPVEARLENADDVNRFRLMPLDDVFDVLEGAQGARIVILDACRNNPVEADIKRRLASISGANRDAYLTRGLSRVAANGLIIAYATQANDVAADGTGRNSPFAAALLRNLGSPGLDVRQMFFNVQDEVDRLTAGKQRPELSISLVGQYKMKPATDATANNEVAPAAPVDPAAQAWAVTRDTTSQAVLQDFIRQFGNSVYGSMASARLEELKKTQVATASFDQELGRSLQLELKRVGCYQGAVNGEFGNATREALRSFVKYSALNLQNEDLSVDTIKAVRSVDKRVCPLSCQPGERAEGDACIRVTAAPARLSGKKCFAFQGREFCE
jgi:uncharacterized caspase-like protein